MEPGILLLIVFILAPLIERLLKAGRQPPRQPPEPQQWPAEEPRPRVIVTRSEDEDESAAAMLPDDLWEILTGEKRAPQLPGRQPPQEPEEEHTFSYEDEAEEEWLQEEQPPTASSPAQAPASDDWRNSTELRFPKEAYSRPIPVQHVPQIVSLEALEIDDEKRHDQFHDRLRQLASPARSRKTPTVFHLSSEEDLRRAIILSEVLGTPRGLQ